MEALIWPMALTLSLVNLFLAFVLSYDYLEWAAIWSNRQYYAVTRLEWFRRRAENADEIAEWICRYLRIPIFIVVNGLVVWMFVGSFLERQP